MAKKSTKVDTKPEIDEKPEVDEEVQSDVPEKPNRTVRPTRLTVTLPNGTSRVYTEYTHGKVWEALAKNFAEANEGAVIE